MAKLSTHVLDTANGCPAAGMQIELWSLTEERRTLLKSVRANADGRTDQALLSESEMKEGRFELIFFVGDYFAAKQTAPSKLRFLDQVPVRFGIPDAKAAYHVPLLAPRGPTARIVEADSFSMNQLAKTVMERIDALGKISDEPDRLTRTFCSPAMRRANDLVASWMREGGDGNANGCYREPHRPISCINEHS